MRTDWMPPSKKGIITVAADWLAVLADKGAAWGVPQAAAAELAGAKALAEARQAEAESPLRSKVTTAECNAAFAALRGVMRGMKKKFFLQPPLETADFLSLSLKPPGRASGPRPAPAVKPGLDAAPSGKGRHTVTAINPETENRKKPDFVGGVAFASRTRESGEPRARAEDMPSVSQTGSQRAFQYEEADYGKVVDYAAAYESPSGKRGPWSDVISLVVA